MIGGDEAAVDEEVRTVLEPVSDTRHFVGDVAGGHVTKAINNAMAFGNTLLAMEAMALGAWFGVDAGALYEVIDSGSGGSNQFAKRMPRVFDRDFDQGFDIDYAIKDLAIATDIAAATDQPLFVTNLVLELYRVAHAQGYGDEDPSAVVKLFETRTTRSRPNGRSTTSFRDTSVGGRSLYPLRPSKPRFGSPVDIASVASFRHPGVTETDLVPDHLYII